MSDIEDVMVKDVSMFRLEKLDMETVWVAVYRGDTKNAERITYHIKAHPAHGISVEKIEDNIDLDRELLGDFLKVLHKKP